MNIPIWLVIAGLGIIAGLSIYAIVLWRRVWQMEHNRRDRENTRNERLAEDLQILAQSLLDGQLPMVEGAIRIKVLLDNYSDPRIASLDLSVWDTVYSATAHIPTHQAWKDLSRAQRELHRRQMDTLERDYGEAVEISARQLCEALPGDAVRMYTPGNG
ncbi:DUF2489 domain-containing protein [Gilvimarinus sp. F26214L]|uniref:DUF2489 domain-containing protein n=1 Tax=Gilvimarinus sp. DZF01 TaxID=3461371 RepID=UPI0040461DAC